MTVSNPTSVARSREILPMSGVAPDQMELDTALDTALRALRPKLRSGKFVLTTLSSAKIGLLASAEAMVAEDEGTAVVLAKDLADGAGLGYDQVAAWITLRGVSPRDGLGTSAIVARALADRGIRCNIMVGHAHDHVLVPWNLRETVVAAIMEIAEAADHRLLSVA